jgi:hypothetical protein
MGIVSISFFPLNNLAPFRRPSVYQDAYLLPPRPGRCNVFDFGAPLLSDASFFCQLFSFTMACGEGMVIAGEAGGSIVVFSGVARRGTCCTICDC